MANDRKRQRNKAWKMLWKPPGKGYRFPLNIKGDIIDKLLVVARQNGRHTLLSACDFMMYARGKKNQKG